MELSSIRCSSRFSSSRPFNFTRVSFDANHSTASCLLLLGLDSLGEYDADGFIRDDIVDYRGDNDGAVDKDCIVQMLCNWDTRWIVKSYKTATTIDVDTSIAN
jgi:hypothetical protein